MSESQKANYIFCIKEKVDKKVFHYRVCLCFIVNSYCTEQTFGL